MGGRGASSGDSKIGIAKNIARELYGRNISDTVATRYAREIIRPSYQSGYGREQGRERSIRELREQLKDLRNPSRLDLPF